MNGMNVLFGLLGGTVLCLVLLAAWILWWAFKLEDE